MKSPKAIVSTRISELAQKKLTQSDFQVELIEHVLTELDGDCPFCEQAWPKKQKQKAHVSVRIDADLVKKLKNIHKVSKFLASAIYLALGICPVCEQPEQKS